MTCTPAAVALTARQLQAPATLRGWVAVSEADQDALCRLLPGVVKARQSYVAADNADACQSSECMRLRDPTLANTRAQVRQRKQRMHTHPYFELMYRNC